LSKENLAGPYQGTPLLIVLSGPSGVGKDAALNVLRTLERPWHFAVTATTRPRRPGERDGIDYIFMEPAEFRDMVARDEVLEHAQVYENWYGVPKQQVRDAMQKGLDVILKVDVQGAATIKKMAPEALSIFMAPPTMEELRQRLSLRDTETAEDLELRTRAAWKEMERLPEFDYKVVNREGRLDEAVACIESIILAEKCRVHPRNISI
jgi:guanylate kinase